MARVCLDTNVLIWGIKRQATPGQEYMIERTARFLRYLEKKQTDCVVPAVVIAELLLPLPLSEHMLFTALVSQTFVVPSFNTLTAALLAKIWQSKKGQVVIPRQEIKFDAMVVATALAAGASCIYSNDPHIEAIALGHIDCKDIPATPEQERFL